MSIETLRREHDATLEQAEAIATAAVAETRELTPTESEQIETLVGRAELLAAEVREQETLMSTAAEAAETRNEAVAAPSVTVTRAESAYRPNGATSYFADVLNASRGDSEARERLTANEREAGDRFETRTGTTTSFGSFIAPVYMLDEYAKKQRPGRVVANLIRNAGSPNAINMSIPRLTVGSLVESQNGQGTAVANRDVESTLLTRSTVTVAGQQDLSTQAIELANGAQLDRIIFEDLRADYDMQLDWQVLNGTGNNGTLLGLSQVADIHAISYTDGSPTPKEAYLSVVSGIQAVHSTRFASPDYIIMHPRRWAFFASAFSTFESLAKIVDTEPGAPESGIVGKLYGIPVVTDANVATTLGAGNNQDAIYAVRLSDHVMFESPLRTRVMSEVGSANLLVRMQLFGYASYFAGRFPKGTAAITGTGLVVPAGFELGS